MNLELIYEDERTQKFKVSDSVRNFSNVQINYLTNAEKFDPETKELILSELTVFIAGRENKVKCNKVANLIIRIYDVINSKERIQYSFDLIYSPMMQSEMQQTIDRVKNSLVQDPNERMCNDIQKFILPEYQIQIKKGTVDDYCTDSWNEGYIMSLKGIIDYLNKVKTKESLKMYYDIFKKLSQKETINPDYDDSWNEGYISCLNRTIEDVEKLNLI